MFLHVNFLYYFFFGHFKIKKQNTTFNWPELAQVFLNINKNASRIIRKKRFFYTIQQLKNIIQKNYINFFYILFL